MWKALVVLAVSLFALPVSATPYVQVIDTFESGVLGSQWSVMDGTYPADIDVYNAISAYYDGGEGPMLYYPPEGSWMMVIESGDPTTTVGTDFTAYSGATLQFSWFFHTLDSPHYTYDDVAGVTINGDEIILITSGTTGGGVGYENTGWQEISIPLFSGLTGMNFWVENGGGEFTHNSQIAIDNIRVTYADGMPPELGGGGDTGGGTIPSVPEPSTSVLMGVGLLSVATMAYRRRKRPAPVDD